MRCKWYFRNEIGENFSETTAFRTKSIWNPPNSHSALEMFLSKVKENFFLVLPVKVSSYNLTKGELFTVRGLAEDHSIVIFPLSGKRKIT